MTDEPEDQEPARAAASGVTRIITIALCFVATGALLIAAFSHRWLAHPAAGRFGGGLLSMERCDSVSDRCTTLSNSDVIAEAQRELPVDDRWVGERPDPPSEWFPRLGVMTLALALVAALALLASAAIAIANKRPELPITPPTVALVALILAIPTACLFAATKPEAIPLGVSWSFWLFGGGNVLGLLAALLVSRQLRPFDPDLLADAMNPEDFPD